MVEGLGLRVGFRAQGSGGFGVWGFGVQGFGLP